MSKYTTEVRFICENAVGLVDSEGYNSVNDIITRALPKVFDFDYPIFDENYRSVLERKILKHFYTREIGEETVGLWKLRLDTRLNEIMPYYNKLYESELLEFDPFMDTNYKRTGKKDTVGVINDDGGSTSNNTRTDDLTSIINDDYTNTRTDNLSSTRTDNLSSVRTDELKNVRTDQLKSLRTDDLESVRTDDLTSKRTDQLHEHNVNDSTDKYSDTPQGGLSGLSNNTYLTNARMVNGEVTVDNTGTQTTENDGTQTIENTGTQTVDNTGKQTFDNTGTQTFDNTGTQKTDNTGTQLNSNKGTRNNKNTGTQKNDNISTTNNTRDISNTDDYFETIIGKVNGVSYSDLLTKFRETFINIDLMIIDNLEDLFICLW